MVSLTFGGQRPLPVSFGSLIGPLTSVLRDGAFLDICELQVDRTGAGTAFGPLAFDTTPGYTDTEPFPATPTKWTYRAIYRVGDQRVGQWSKSVSITVGG